MKVGKNRGKKKKRKEDGKEPRQRVEAGVSPALAFPVEGCRAYGNGGRRGDQQDAS